ncbi:histone-lysine N-methyltransferase SETMAR [Elysia marginata]|uniref:Histone-lysine N-methyltransferase SETMAR n=1 Tax=Elysia marginata TaxID=1093978 RepID=A0AAV4IA99_9GAST|nr:histone-lysine N-methyltransferase SETMAR [Elysia marginata]
MESEPRPGRPVTACGDANIFEVLVSLSDDRRKTCEEITTETSMSRTSVFIVQINKLNKKKFPKILWVSHLLTDEQKESRVNFSRNFLRRFQTEQNDFLCWIIIERLGCIPGILKQSGSQPNGETLMSLVQRKFDANKWLSRLCTSSFFI